MHIDNYVPKNQDGVKRVKTLVEVICRREKEIQGAEALIADKKKDIGIMTENMKNIKIEDAERNGWFLTQVTFDLLCSREYRKAKLEFLIRQSLKAEHDKLNSGSERIHFDLLNALLEQRNFYVSVDIKTLPRFYKFLRGISKNDIIIVSVIKS